MDALLFLDDDDPLSDMFTSPEEVQLPSSCDQVEIREPNQQENLNSQELSLIDLLLMCAQAVEAEKWHLGSSLIARLDHLLSFNRDNDQASPFLRLAYLFTHGLKSRATARQPAPPQPPQAPPPVSDISAYQMVQELLPFVKLGVCGI